MSAPCFHPYCTVELVDNNIIKICDIKKGDIVLTSNNSYDIVECVIKTKCNNNECRLVEIIDGLLVTE